MKKIKNFNSHTLILRYIVVLISFMILFSSLQFFNLDKINAITLRELGEEISKLSSDEENLLKEIIASETDVEIKREKIKSLNQELGELTSSLEELTSQREELKQNINHKRELLEERAVYSYKYGNDEIAKLLISAGDINEVANTLYLFRSIMKKEAWLIEELRLEKEEYDRVLRESEQKKEEIEEAREQIIAEEKKLQESIEKNKQLLEKVKSEKSELQVLLSEIKRRIAEVQPPGLSLAGEWEMVATAYYSGGGGLSGNGITSIGLRVRKGIVAVDPRVIPLGTKLYIPGYGEALAADTGGWIKGNRIDLAFESLEECYRWGRRRIKVYLVDE